MPSDYIKTLKKVVVTLCILAGFGLVIGLGWFVNVSLAPLFLNSRFERIGEKDLPKIIIQKDGTVYCRMKADDFRFPLPPGSRALNPILTLRGFDSVHGTVEARFETSNHLSATQYENWVSGNVQEGSYITANRFREVC